MSARLMTAAAVVDCVKTLVGPLDNAPDVWQQFWDAVNSGGSFTDVELEAMGITAAQLSSCVTLLEAFNALMANGIPVVSTYRITINTVRHTPTGYGWFS